MKVGLYEDCRHLDFVQPTGVNWTAATKSLQSREIVPVTNITKDIFCAVFVNGLALVASIRDNGGMLRVGVDGAAESWSLTDDSCRIITLQDTACTSGRGEEVWVLVHLPYPLAYVVESYEILEVGSREPTK